MTKPEFIRAVTPKFKPRYENFIGGEWVAPVAGRYFENTSPVNGRVLCEVAEVTHPTSPPFTRREARATVVAAPADAASPTIIEDASDSSSLYVLMPMRV